MSTTDNAFIKVYHRDQVENVEGPSATNLEAVEAATPGAQKAGERAAFPRPPHAWSKQGTKSNSKNTQETRRRLSQSTWSDAAHVGPPAPHLNVERFSKGPAVQSLPGTTRTTAPMKFAAGWEVDHFSWPTICNELQDHWIGPLTSIVRSIVRQAWQGGNVVAVTQATRSEGASTLALCLSRIAASFQVPVALVDGHQQNPQIAKLLKLQFEHGWDEASPTFPLEEAAIRSIEDGLVVMPLRGAGEKSAWEVAPSLRSQITAQLSSSFELVVIDMGPMYVAAHDWFQPPCSQHIGCAMVLRDIRATESAQTEDVCHRIRASGIENISIVENFQVA